jgi:hypothetical protein
VTGIGYSRAGEVPPRSWGIRVKSGAGPLFRFSRWHEESDDETMLTASRKDLESLAQGVALEVGVSASVLPRLPGRKLVNANSSQHLEKRLRRYATFLQELADHAAAGRSAALAAFWGSGERLEPGQHGSAQPRTSLARELGRHGDEVLEAEVQRLEEKVARLEAQQRGWSSALGQVLLATVFSEERAEGHRLRLQRALDRALAETDERDRITQVKCTAVRLPRTAEGAPRLALTKPLSDGSALWSFNWDGDECSVDLALSGRRLAVHFACQVTVRGSLAGVCHARVIPAKQRSATRAALRISFRHVPRVSLHVAAARVTWGALPMPVLDSMTRSAPPNPLVNRSLPCARVGPPELTSVPQVQGNRLSD